jgi:hypothetical protein
MARKSKTNKKLSKKLDKLEKRGDELRAKAEKRGKELSTTAAARGKELQAKASDRFDAIPAPAKEKRRGKKRSFLVLLTAVGGALFALKKKRDQELDEALWEEPRSI